MAMLLKPEKYGDYKGTWLAKEQKEYGKNELGQYCLAIYWSIQTITTVGFGDLTGVNNYERLFSALIMLVGVILFNVSQGYIGSLMASDNITAKYENYLDTLNEINKEFPLP